MGKPRKVDQEKQTPDLLDRLQGLSLSLQQIQVPASKEKIKDLEESANATVSSLKLICAKLSEKLSKLPIKKEEKKAMTDYMNTVSVELNAISKDLKSYFQALATLKEPKDIKTAAMVTEPLNHISNTANMAYLYLCSAFSSQDFAQACAKLESRSHSTGLFKKAKESVKNALETPIDKFLDFAAELFQKEGISKSHFPSPSGIANFTPIKPENFDELLYGKPGEEEALSPEEVENVFNTLMEMEKREAEAQARKHRGPSS